MPTKIFVSQIDNTLSNGDPAGVGSLIYLGVDGPTWKSIEEIYPSGFQGSEGDRGQTGFRGSVGVYGPTGFYGSAGDRGDPGANGYKGSTGYFGSVGDQGEVGYFGSVGYNGSVGDQGILGFPGYNGSIGPDGDQGPVGYRGSVGISGYTGSKGAIDPFGFLNLSDVASNYDSYNNFSGAYVRVNTDRDGLSLDTTPLLSTDTHVDSNFNGSTLSKPVFKGYAETVVNATPVDDAIVVNVLDGNVIKLTLTAEVTTVILENTYNVPDIQDGRLFSVTFFITQGVGGNFIDWSSNTIRWSTGDGVDDMTGPILSVSQYYMDIVTLYTHDGGITWFGVLGAKGFYVP